MKFHPKQLAGAILAALALVVMVIPARAAADINPEAEVILRSRAEGFTLHLLMANLLEENTTLQLTDLNGEVYYTRFIRNHNGFKQDLHLKNLPDGRYVLRVKQADEELSQVVLVTDTGLLISKVHVD